MKCTANRWMRWAVYVARFGMNRNISTGVGTGNEMKEKTCTWI